MSASAEDVDINAFLVSNVTKVLCAKKEEIEKISTKENKRNLD